MDYAQTSLGTPFFLSPEICQGEKYNYKTDIWMVGCVIYELCSLKKPFNGDNLMVLMRNIVTEKVPPIPDNYSDNLKHIVNILMMKDQNDRPLIRDILDIDFVQQKMKELKILDLESPCVSPKNVKFDSKNELNLQLNSMSSNEVIDCGLQNSVSQQNLHDNHKNSVNDKSMMSSKSGMLGNDDGKTKQRRRPTDKINKKYDSMGVGALNNVLNQMNMGEDIQDQTYYFY